MKKNGCVLRKEKSYVERKCNRYMLGKIKELNKNYSIFLYIIHHYQHPSISPVCSTLSIIRL